MNNEQWIREQFEKWLADTVLRRAPQPGQRFERDDVGGYIDPTVHDMWRGYVAGVQAMAWLWFKRAALAGGETGEAE